MVRKAIPGSRMDPTLPQRCAHNSGLASQVVHPSVNNDSWEMDTVSYQHAEVLILLRKRRALNPGVAERIECEPGACQ